MILVDLKSKKINQRYSSNSCVINYGNIKENVIKVF